MKEVILKGGEVEVRRGELRTVEMLLRKEHSRGNQTQACLNHFPWKKFYCFVVFASVTYGKSHICLPYCSPPSEVVLSAAIKN